MQRQQQGQESRRREQKPTDQRPSADYGRPQGQNLRSQEAGGIENLNVSSMLGKSGSFDFL